MSAHTPGPWYVEDIDKRPIRIESHQDGFVADVRAGFSDAAPNARLIAAAPELLDALRAFCGDYESTPTTSDTSLKAAYLHALQAIAKAEER